RPQLRLDHRNARPERPARPRLRLRRHVLRRPDLEARQLRPDPSTRGPALPAGPFALPLTPPPGDAADTTLSAASAYRGAERACEGCPKFRLRRAACTIAHP